jgi:hypothetical protein
LQNSDQDAAEMSTVKKSQHYVWQNYLRAWAHDQRIWTLDKKVGSIFNSNLTGVAQERYFYKLQNISEKGLEFLHNFIKASPSSNQGFQRDFLATFSLPSEIKKRVQSSGQNELLSHLHKMEINTMEDAHSYFENFGKNLLSVKSLNDLQNFENADIKNESIIYICFQYLRTRRMRQSIARGIGEGASLPELSVWNILVFLMSLNAAMSISLCPTTTFSLLENSLDLAFITGDQPAINLMGNSRDSQGNVNSLQLYYPLSPTLALIIDMDSPTDKKYRSVQPDVATIRSLNSSLFQNCDHFVFSSNREQLSQFA